MAQAQLPNWYFFNPSGNGSIVRFNPNNSNIPMLYSSSIPVFMDANFPTPNPITNYNSVNAMYDNNGAAIFYIVQAEILGHKHAYFYDKNGVIIKAHFGDDFSSDFPISREISIIDVGCERYHVVVGDRIIELNIALNEWQELPFTDVNSSIIKALNVNGISGPQYDVYTVAFEISDVNAISYKIYSLYGNVPGTNGDRFIRTIEINKINNQVIAINDLNIMSVNLPGNPIPRNTQITETVAELEISKNKTLLALAEDNLILIFNLNTNGLPTTVNAYYDYQPSSVQIDYEVAGLEFDETNSKLIFSKYNPANNPSFPDMVGVWDFTSINPPIYVSSSTGYGRSQIEMGKDNKIYISSSTHLAEVTTGSTPSINNVISLNMSLNNDVNSCEIRTLPDQITGYNYNATAFDISSFDANTSGTWTSGVGNNPFNANGSLSVLNKITIKSGVNITVKDFVFNFFTNAELIIEPGASLIMQHCTLQGHECAVMWKGVSIEDNGTTGGQFQLTSNNALQTSLLKDAITGIKVVGPNSWLIVHGYSQFTANETDIKITNGNKDNIQIHRSSFMGGVPLKDQTKGSNYGWLGDNLYRTKHNIWLENCNSKITIGSATQQGCDFQDAEYGIKAIKSDMEVFQNSFTGHKLYGILGDARKIAKKQINIIENLFSFVQQPIRLENWINSDIYTNTFVNSFEYGIHYLENENCILNIGLESDPSKGNSFDFCNWAAIDLSANVGSKSEIYICNNTIINHPYATGIVLNEYSQPAIGGSYKILRIKKNTMNQIGAGIKLNNIAGWNNISLSDGPRPHEAGTYDVNSVIQNNNINFTTNLFPHNQMGIQTTHSNKINILDNIVASDNPGDWRNTGILTDDAFFTSIYNNISSGGSGIRIGGNMLTSNVYCNYLNGCVTGIFLNYCYLRGIGATHGILPNPNNTSNQARKNTFSTLSGGFDMKLYYTNVDLNQWVFFTSPPPNSIDYTLASGSVIPYSIEAGLAKDPCVASVERNEGVIDSNASGAAAKTSVSSPGPITISKTVAFIPSAIEQVKINLKNAKDSIGIKGKKIDFAADLASIDELLVKKDYLAAATKLKSTKPISNLESELFSTYEIICAKKANNRPLTKTEIDLLMRIASKNQFTESVAAPLARIILKEELHLDIYDSLTNYPDIIGSLDQTCSVSFLGGIKIKLVTAQNTETGISTYTDSLGSFKFNTYDLRLLNSTAQYKFTCKLADSSLLQSGLTSIGHFTRLPNTNVTCAPVLLKKGISQKVEIANNFEEIKIYPNPSNGIIKLNCPTAAKVSVYNLKGDLVYQNFYLPNPEINLSSLSKGLYLLRIEAGESKNFKIILE